jgi:MinD-like ATPase involved in chromosome partitioning or flagellar assembly
LTESNERQDLYPQWAGEHEPGESRGDHAGDAPAPPPSAPEPSTTPLDPDGHTQIFDRENLRRDLDALRHPPGPSGGPGGGPGLGYPDAGGPERGRHTIGTPPGRTPQEGPPPSPREVPRRPAYPSESSPAPGYGAWPPAGAPGRQGSHFDADPYASVGSMRAQIHESQVSAPYKPVPETGWRHGLYKVTRINVGLSASEMHWNDLRRRLKVNLRGKYVIAVMQSKGGVNKTTTAALIGAALAEYRDEKIVAIDANPAHGNLSERVDEPSTMSWRGLNSDQNLRSYSDYREFLGKDSTSGLEVLGSDPGRPPMTGIDLRKSWAILQRYYPIAVVDCGNQLDDDITRALLEDIAVDAIVVPSTTRLDGARGAAATLNWLLENGYPHLVHEAVVVVSNINKINASAQVKQLHADFERTVRSVHDVGFDPHLSDAVAIEYTRLQPDTWLRYVEAAASLADGFARANDERAPRRGGAAPRDVGPRPPWGPGGRDGGESWGPRR